jgi:4-aminobutyrate aminotransferase-like enzyme
MRALRAASLAAAGGVAALAVYLLRRRARWRRIAWCIEPGLKAKLLAMRMRDFCPACSISYANTDPLLIVAGRGATLIDESGRRFIDTRNNVAHVGHAHPAVAAAVADQVATLNTNTRYLHPSACQLARRLLDTMPPPLRDGKIFFVNSGSEANDLALRLARARTKHRRCLVVEHAYHGHTCEAVGLSPYKFEHASFGGKGQPDWVRQLPCPDVYRGAHRGPDAAEQYAGAVADACADASRAEGGVCAFFIESGMSVAGVLLPPQGYLRAAYEAVRAAGGVCVADEVQTGLGRFGDVWWGFEQQGVVPDIVTMGKPMGNGMPLAAVVCTREVSDAFALGPEYFNTFGGNPVSAAAGLAVLDAIEADGLRGNAHSVGGALRAQLRALAACPSGDGELIGDVRGAGLFIGIEFVRDRERRLPVPSLYLLVGARPRAPAPRCRRGLSDLLASQGRAPDPHLARRARRQRHGDQAAAVLLARAGRGARAGCEARARRDARPRPLGGGQDAHLKYYVVSTT